MQTYRSQEEEAGRFTWVQNKNGEWVRVADPPVTEEAE